MNNLNEFKNSNKTPQQNGINQEKNEYEKKNEINNDDVKNKTNNNQSKINYFTYIKEFLSKNNNDQEYGNIIKENPDVLFEKIDEKRIVMWESLLFSTSSPLKKNSEFDILYYPLDREDQIVIRNDCKRTRVRESVLVPGFPKILEALFCMSKKDDEGDEIGSH